MRHLETALIIRLMRQSNLYIIHTDRCDTRNKVFYAEQKKHIVSNIRQVRISVFVIKIVKTDVLLDKQEKLIII